MSQLQPAIYILKTPCLWEKTPQSSTGPSPFASNTTYLARALAYVYAADQTYDTYIKPWFFQADGTIQQPDDPRWNDLQDLKAGSAMPWNRRFLVRSLFRRPRSFRRCSMACSRWRPSTRCRA